MKSAFEHSGNKLIYHWRESIGTAIFLTVFALIWNAVVFGATYTIFTGNGFHIDDVPYTSIAEAFDQNPIILIFLVFPVVGLVFGYLALCIWVNRTTFSWDGMYLTKKTTPLPIKGDFKVSHSTVKKVFIQKTAAAQTKPNNQSFNIVATMTDGSEMIIHKMGLQIEDATLLETWIKEKLNLV